MHEMSPRPFIGVYFTRCLVYGRLYPNKEGSHFVGSCPRCGLPIKIKRGQEGVKVRMLQITCAERVS